METFTLFVLGAEKAKLEKYFPIIKFHTNMLHKAVAKFSSDQLYYGVASRLIKNSAVKKELLDTMKPRGSRETVERVNF